MLKKKGKYGENSLWNCDVCNKVFEITNSRATEALKRKMQKLCGRECYLAWCRVNGHKNVTEWAKKNIHPRLTKGSGLTTDGYVWIYAKNPAHHNNQMKIHIYLMETKIGRKIKRGEVVHHIDGNKLNNCLENLQLLTISEHNKIHKHFTKDKRDDIWSKSETAFAIKNNYEDFSKVYTRTRGAFHRKKHIIKCGSSLKGD